MADLSGGASPSGSFQLELRRSCSEPGARPSTSSELARSTRQGGRNFAFQVLLDYQLMRGADTGRAHTTTCMKTRCSSSSFSDLGGGATGCNSYRRTCSAAACGEHGPGICQGGSGIPREGICGREVELADAGAWAQIECSTPREREYDRERTAVELFQSRRGCTRRTRRWCNGQASHKVQLRQTDGHTGEEPARLGIGRETVTGVPIRAASTW